VAWLCQAEVADRQKQSRRCQESGVGNEAAREGVPALFLHMLHAAFYVRETRLGVIYLPKREAFPCRHEIYMFSPSFFTLASPPLVYDVMGSEAAIQLSQPRHPSFILGARALVRKARRRASEVVVERHAHYK